MPKSLAMVLLPLVCGALSPVFALTLDTVDSSNPGQTTAPRLAQVGTVETMLYFETESRVVRIFRQGSELSMNLYNKATDVVEVNGVPAELVPSSRDQVVYKNSLGEAERFAHINALGETELEIIAADGTMVLQEPGFNAVVGVPDGATDFQGNNVAPGNGAIVISREYANLRSEPRLGSDILGSANRREIVQVLERVGNPEDGYLWYRVVYNGTTGWVRGDLLQLA